MLALRLVRGGSPLTLLRRLLVACATAVVAFLLLAALSHALAHPQDSSASLVRLVWCAVPLAAAVQFAAAVARTEPGSRSRSALDVAGVGPARVPLLAAVSTAVSALLGSGIALVVYLHLRGQLATLPFDGAAVRLLAAEQPLPVAATLVLLALPPVAAGVGAALATRPRVAPAVAAATAPVGAGGATVPSAVSATGAGGDALAPADVIPQRDEPAFRMTHGPLPAAATLPWGTALIAAGLAMETYASRSPKPLPLSSVLSNSAPGVLGGWVLTAVGLILAGPGLTQLCGWLLSVGRPGAVRLLSGRVLQREARRLGRPLGVLCAVAAGALAAGELYARAPEDGARLLGPLTILGSALVVFCVLASALTAAAETRAFRSSANAALVRLGAPRRVLRGAVALRLCVLAVVLGSLTYAVAELAALPLTS
ncbi:hypothetical protein GCM10012287_21590 [Streptomyces daqingensis]|uniref:ABC transporter permease n=1 Tax=Streptomyces daqingensis TaxID=1472640 RepID=A0ABQ2M7S0_9ACTN|nr:hypothetical protein [Streptomyces daqingensis]GGO47888.1 hypothetical protein GCM10012287_21590 [Streptomyces daqingensis]